MLGWEYPGHKNSEESGLVYVMETCQGNIIVSNIIGQWSPNKIRSSV